MQLQNEEDLFYDFFDTFDDETWQGDEVDTVGLFFDIFITYLFDKITAMI